MDSVVWMTFIVCGSIVAIVGIALIQDFLLKRERIRADAMVRVEEVKAKNQFEIERLLTSDSAGTGSHNVDSSESCDNDNIKRQKLKY